MSGRPATRPNGPATGLPGELSEPKSIAIVMLSALGDAVHVLPVVNALRRRWPDARISWVIQPVPHRLVQGHRAVDEFLVFHRRRGESALRSFREMRRQAAGRSFDLVINLQVYLKAGLITGLLDSPVKLGFDRKRAKDLNWAFTTHRIPPRAPGHVQDQYLEFVEYLGIDPRPVTWDLPLTDDERAAQQAWLERLDRPVCTAVVGTSKREKNWLPERYAELLDHVYHDFGLQPVLLAGPSLVEQALAAAIKAALRVPVVDVIGDDIRRMVWLLDGSAIVVSPDTGPLHVARALDRPVVGLYGYTNPLRYGPYGRPESVVDGFARYPGEPYGEAAGHRAEGMQRVTVASALEVLERVLRSGVAPAARARGVN